MGNRVKRTMVLFRGEKQMRDIRARRFVCLCIALCVIVFSLTGCATGRIHHATSIVDYLYPENQGLTITPSIPTLSLPMRVGIAFVPAPSDGRLEQRHFWGMAGPATTTPGLDPLGRTYQFALTESKKMTLMKEVADHFSKHPFVKSIDLIPSAYLTPRGSFTNLDQIRTMYGLDVIALVSYDQTQFTDQDMLSISYWTLIGAYMVPGEKNDTHTMLDAAVYDIVSRKMLFRAPGISHLKGRSTPINLPEQLRGDGETGFNAAAKQMIANLDEQLTLFKEKVKTQPSEYKVVHRPGYTGSGSLDSITVVLVALLGGGLLWMRRRG